MTIGEHAVRPSSESLRELSLLQGEPVMTSVYLDVDGKDVPRRAALDARHDQLFDAALHQAARAGLTVSETVIADVAAIRTRLSAGVDRRHTRGIAAFSCSKQGILIFFEAPIAFVDEVSFDRIPHLRQLVTLELARPALVVLIDRRTSRLVRLEPADGMELQGPRDELERQVDTDTELGGFERRHNGATHRHVRRVALAVGPALQESDAEQLILGGPLARELAGCLPPPAANRLIGMISVGMTAPIDEVVHLAHERIAATRRTRHRALLEDLRARAGIGTTVGIETTLEALNEHRVFTLVMSSEFRPGGVRCTSCGFLALEGDRCRRCGAPSEVLPDLGAAVLVDAIRERAAVELLEGDDYELDGGIGAVERY